MAIFFLQNLKLFTKAQILFWQLFTKVQYYFGNFYKKAQYYFIKKPKTIGQTIILLKPKYNLEKLITLCSKPKTFPWQKHIFIYLSPKLIGSINYL